MFRKPKLPDADKVFNQYFAPWYDPAVRARRRYRGTRPDMEQIYRPGLHAAEIILLTLEGLAESEKRVQGMGAAARGDWVESIGVSGEPSLGWIDAFDKHYNRERVAEVIKRSNPEDFGNDLVILACEFGAILGEVIRGLEPGLEWLYDWPYWESSLLEPTRGLSINVFHWAIKKFSGYGVDDGYVAKINQCRKVIHERP